MCTNQPTPDVTATIELTPTDIVEASTRAYGANSEGLRLAHVDSSARASLDAFVPPSRTAREDAQELVLSPGATRAHGAGLRAVDEDPDPYRTCFEQDVDRIIHTSAFRRQAGKCQVFMAPDDIHLRTRLTHALEVHQIAKSVSYATGLNATLAEAIALGHDCGHGPGGHAAERALGVFLDEGFDHAIWGADVTLAPLNLCRETLEGIRQHSWRLSAPSTPEAEVVSWADRIAYVTHDYNDALRHGILSPRDLPISLRDSCGPDQASQIRFFSSALISTTVTTGAIAMDEPHARVLDEFRRFNYERIYESPRAVISNSHVVDVLRFLVEFCAANPALIPEHPHEVPHSYTSNQDLYRAVRYVASMTDRYALDLYSAWHH